jgi:hypothetical protein
MCTLGKKLKQAKEFLQDEMDSLNTTVRTVRKTSNELEKMSTDAKQNTTDVIKEVRKQARDLTILIDQTAELKIKFMSIVEQENLSPMESYKKSLDNYVEKARSAYRFLEDLQEDDMSLELLECYTQYKKNVESLQATILNKNICTKQFSFSPGKLRSWKDLHFFRFGEVRMESKEQIFLHVPKEQKLTVLRRLRYIFSIRNIMLVLMPIFMLITVSRICASFSDESDKSPDAICGLFFFLYISLAAVVSYVKG